MYAMLSYLPTALLPSKIPFARYVKQHILDPLGMKSTTYSSEVANKTGNFADGLLQTVVTDSNGTGVAGPPVRIPYWIPSNEDGGGEEMHHSF